MPFVDLSFGDALDRLSVLKIKQKYLHDIPDKLEIVNKEEELLRSSILCWCKDNNISLETYDELLSLLVSVNEEGWIEHERMRTFIDSSHNITGESLHSSHIKMMLINDKRIKAKNLADTSVGYSFKEIKSYTL